MPLPTVVTASTFGRKKNPSTKHGIWLLKALQAEFGQDLVVFLDRAGYFYTRDLWGYVSGERSTETVGDTSLECVKGEHLEVWYFPPKLPELNPVEGCWDRLKEWFKHRLVPDLPTLKHQMQRGLSTVDEPNIWNYISP